ncbi:MAG: nucleotidyltransferase domain-containing protein [Candidatus Brocadiae bacterium]|nr:nucleotidyltransferase domain-containing protein [Candidatus Brocadiia bacterium]
MAVLNRMIEQRARRAVEFLSQYATVSAAYVFGSQAEGLTDEFSDLDIGVFIENIEDWDFATRGKMCALVRKEAGDDVEVHLLSARMLSEADPASFAAHILRHGVPVAENMGAP